MEKCDLDLRLKLSQIYEQVCIVLKILEIYLEKSYLFKIHSFHNLVVKGNCVLCRFKNDLCVSGKKVLEYKKKTFLVGPSA